MSERRKQTERLHLLLKQAGGYWTSADQITQQTGMTRVAARIYDLKKDGVEIESKFVGKSKCKSYRLTAAERAGTKAAPTPEPAPEEFPTDFFGGADAAPAKSTSHHQYEDAA